MYRFKVILMETFQEAPYRRERSSTIGRGADVDTT